MIMTLAKNAGLADPGCQLYMFFYALGPATLIVPLLLSGDNEWPSSRTIGKAAAICLYDIFCTILNYTGASLAGPTIFAIVYSSVTVWTALFSQLFLNRPLRLGQWAAILTVFGGLCLTATESLQLGDDVRTGLLLLLVGSAMHALTYTMSEGIMTVSAETLTAPQNNAVQSVVGAAALGLWQCAYTLPRWDERMRRPMRDAGTTPIGAAAVLGLFALSNLAHSSAFFHTLRHFPGGSTSAGVMKGLQAVLVFAATHLAYCGRVGGAEMCFTRGKTLALITVVGGVAGFGAATRYYQNAAATGAEKKTVVAENPHSSRNQNNESLPLLNGHLM